MNGARVSRGSFRGVDVVVLSAPVTKRARVAPPAPSSTCLTASERAIAAMLQDGRTNAEIATARGRSLRTVANQVSSILRKLRADSRHQVRVDPPRVEDGDG